MVVWWCSGSPIHHTLTYHTILILVDGGLVAPYQSIPVSQLAGQWPEGIPPTRNILHILIPWFPIVRNTLNLWWSAAKAKKRRRDTRAHFLTRKRKYLVSFTSLCFLISFISFQVASYFGCSLSCAPTTSIWFIFCLISLCVYLYFVGATSYFILGLLCIFPLLCCRDPIFGL